MKKSPVLYSRQNSLSDDNDCFLPTVHFRSIAKVRWVCYVHNATRQVVQFFRHWISQPQTAWPRGSFFHLSNRFSFWDITMSGLQKPQRITDPCFFLLFRRTFSFNFLSNLFRVGVPFTDPKGHFLQ